MEQNVALPLAGVGYDIHRLEAGRPMILGGVEITGAESGPLAHSDGDALLHAICDALLGAAALGDIGMHFPDNDPAYRGISSSVLLQRVIGLLAGNGYVPNNIDCMIILERPKISPFRDAMRSAISAATGLPEERVSVKATTSEGLGPIGEGKGVAAYAVATIRKLVAKQIKTEPA